jgi:hypothetical protein
MWTIMNRPCAAFYRHPVTFPNGVQEICYGIALPVAPDRPDGTPLAIAVEIPRSGLHWLSPAAPAMVAMAEEFAFMDIGAGQPEALAPPDDWLPAAA